MKGDIPPVIDVPTGLGKTGVMAAWLVARTQAAALPRRLVYVVDRRAVVDQATREAERLRDLLERDPEMKGHLCLEGRPLPVSTLRGQFVDNEEWMADPAAPAIVVGTVDMIGSRLLFEGYAVSRKMRPYHAGLLGVDTLLVLDEAHLVPPFRKLVGAIASWKEAFGPRTEFEGSIPPFLCIAMSATGESAGADRALGLSADDERHEEARLRLSAKKSLDIRPIGGNDIAKELAIEAWRLAKSGPSRIAVYCDSHQVARQVAADLKSKIRKNKQDPQGVELLVGARRVHERQRVDKWLADHGFLRERDGAPNPLAYPAFLVATSAGEVGVDLDAQHMVGDVVAWERMVQRLGRVNRFGQGEARIIVISGQKPKGKAKKAEEGPQEHDGAEERRKAVLELLGKLPSADGHHTASPRDLRGLAPEAELIRRATTPAPLRPQLDRALVDAWAMTSLKEHTGRPEIQPWLRGWVSEEAQTRLAWRRHIPVRTAEGTVAVAMQPREVNEFFEAAPVELPEMLETETWKVVKWLRERAERRWPERDDQLIDETKRTRPLIEDVVGLVLDPADEHVTTLTGLDLQQREEKWLVSDLVGRTLVLDARLAGLSEDGLLEKGADDPPSTIDDETWGERPFRVRSVAANETGGSSPAWVEEVRLASETDDEGAVQRFLVVDVPVGKATTVDARSAGPPQRLAEHSEITAERAHRLASALGLTEALSKTLVVAARLHDEGKSARAWQEAFGAPVDGEPYAKTNVRRIDHQRLGGYRHELGSLLLAEQDEAIRGLPGDLRDLALHLIAAHHGHARPLMPTRGVEELPPSRLQDKATEIALRFARLQKQWGPWGLAWLESLLRAADHQASAMNDERKESR